jgi:hypothetical protein
MIVSVHVTKTAGTSFGTALRREFGARFMHDDEDWAGYKTPEANARRAANAARMRARRDELLERFDVIHGHFAPEKYAGLFPRTEFVAFFRDPFQQAVSHYQFLSRLPPTLDHPVARDFHAARMTLEDFIAWEATRNPQAQLIGELAVEDFAMVGLTEQFARSVVLFNEMFGCRLESDVLENTNPTRNGSGYPINESLRRHIARHREEDIDLYRRAEARFDRLIMRRSIFQVGGSPAAPKFGLLDSPVDPRKAQLVSAAIDRYGLKSIMDVGACWGVHGAYTFHALQSGKIERALIIDGEITHLSRTRAADDARIALMEGDIGEAEFVARLPDCDAAIVFDVLLHQVAPDWDQFIARYAFKVNHFVIWNQDWVGSDSTVRYVERGLDWYLANVPEMDAARVRRWFARHDEICPRFNRPWRDVPDYWQWGITSPDLIDAMHGAGFVLDYFNNFGVWSAQCPNIQLNGYLFRRPAPR